ncbi:MAG: D-glycero-beta-D-manno-heptose-7-phosphate kinase [Bacteroidota bacterium]|nr:D-glycero-beta-D-manno-heptose-7-phosphate kinase [Bacteroidota bacterium]
MVTISEKRLEELLRSMNGKRIAVVGDLMLDRYIWGSVNRISPEAPVPVVDMETEQVRLGGAANVANNIKSLGGMPLLVGVVGNDNSGKQLSELICENNFEKDGIIVDNSRPTTVKTRVIAHNQHVVRIDREQKSDISVDIQAKLIVVLERNIETLGGIIIEDYNKGVVAKTLITSIITLVNKYNKIITVDPKFNNFFEYKNVTVFKPNRKETEEVLGERIRTQEDIVKAGKSLLEKSKANNVLLTLGEHGMSLFESNGDISHVPTKALNVADVSGAGDTVISTLTMVLAGGGTVKEAATLANFAGGIVCGYVGIVPINIDELKLSILNDNDHQAQGNL